MKEEWELRKDHWEAYNQAFKDSGCKFFENSKNISYFNGKKFFECLKKLGHDSSDFSKCVCRKKSV